MPVLRGFPAEGVVALFDEAPGGGEIDDINSPRNGPAKTPQDFVTQVAWHSDFFQYEKAFPDQTVAVTHPALSGRTIVYGGGGFLWNLPGFAAYGQTAEFQHTLLTHNLGYTPLVHVVYDGVLVSPGTIVQSETGGRSRMVSIFATSTVVGLHEAARSSGSDLPAVSRSYDVRVYREPTADPSKPLFGKTGSNVIIGRGKIDTSKRYLRKVAPGETPYTIPLGPIGDHANGRKRVVLGSTVITEDNYTGSFTGPEYLTIGD